MTGVLLAVGDDVFRAGLAMLVDADPDLRVAGQVDTAAALPAALAKARPDVLLLDLQLPGLDAEEQTREAAAATRVVLLARFVRDDDIDAALVAGASGFVTRTATPEQILAALRAG